MKQGSFLSLILVAVLCTLITIGNTSLTIAQVMESMSYQMQSDSLNIGGGFSSSTNYEHESTFSEIGTGQSTSTSYNLYAGYQQMQSSFISLSPATDVIMVGVTPGVTGGTSNGSTTVTVITDNSNGYTLTLEASTDPAMQNGSDFISNYEAGADPDFSFIIGSTDAVFGFSPEGVDVAPRYLDLGGICNTGTGNSSFSCWEGVSTTPLTIASANSATLPAGATTTILFRVGIGGSVNQAPGTYIATTTITATPL